MARDNYLTVRLDDTEMSELKKNAVASGLSVSRYIRVLIRHKGKVSIFDEKIIAEILLQLKREGTNLNQLTRRINRKGTDPGTLAKLEHALDDISKTANRACIALSEIRKPF